MVIFALPRGGVVLGFEIAKKLSAPLDLVISRKVGHPLNQEYAICAVTEDGEIICNERERAAVDGAWLAEAIQKEIAEAKRRRAKYFGLAKPEIGVRRVSIEGKVAIIVDDGIATGLTMRAAILDIKSKKPGKIIVAVPVVPRDIAEIMKKDADDLVALEISENFLGSVGAYYESFPQVEDEEVIKLLIRSRRRGRGTVSL